MFEWRKNQCFKDQLRPRPQGAKVAVIPIRVIYIPARASCSWLHTSQWGLVVGVKCSPCFAQLSDWIACSSQDTRPGSTWNHHLCWSFMFPLKFDWTPETSAETVVSCWAGPGILWWTCYPIRKLGKTGRALDSTHQSPLASTQPWTRGSGRYIYDMDGNSSHFSALRTSTEMVLETLVFSPFNHLTQLVAQEDFIMNHSNCSKCLPWDSVHFSAHITSDWLASVVASGWFRMCSSAAKIWRSSAGLVWTSVSYTELFKWPQRR
jgi:hypothetical protein